MLSLAKAAKDYYLRKLGEISPRQDYYLRGGTATGRWVGSGAAELGLEGAVSAEGLVRLFDGRHPASGERLGRKLRRDGVAAWDLTFSADKSVSLLWALGDNHTRQEVLRGFEEATRQALGYLESVASSTRGAKRVPVTDDHGNPVLNEDGTPATRTETWSIPTTGYVAAAFTEFTSRANDPQLHTHVVVANRVKGREDDRWRALDGRLLYRHQLAAGYLGEAVLRRELTLRLGVRWQPVERGMADIEGFTRDQIEAFSRRREELEAWREAQGLAETPSAREVATLATRGAKRDHPLETLLPEWRERALEVGLTPERMASFLHRSREVTVPNREAIFARLVSPEGLTREVSTFGRAEVIQGIAASLPEGGTWAEVEELATLFAWHREVVPLLPDHRGRGDEREEALPVPEGETACEEPERTMRRRDGTLFPGVEEPRFSTAELLATEQRIVERALEGIEAGRWAVDVHHLEQVLGRHPHLTRGQREMVLRLARSGSSIEVGVGPAGSGKTAVVAVLRDLASRTVTPIYGAALAARAGSGLRAATGVPSATIARLLWETRERGLPDRTVLVVDEAGMVGTRTLARISDLVEEARGKLILLGDDRQLPEMEAGGLFRALARRLPAVELTENVRQREPWERQALAELRDGSVERALSVYRERDRLWEVGCPEEAVARAVGDWQADLRETGDPAGALLLAYRNETVDKLNRRAREATEASGRLRGSPLWAGERPYRRGDRVLAFKNHRGLGVLNGDLGTVVRVDRRKQVLTVRMDRDQAERTLPLSYASDHLSYGYALTAHKAQGVTVRRAFTVAEGTAQREWTYVAMSRGREANRLYVTRTEPEERCTHVAHHQLPGLETFARRLQRSGAQRAALDSGRPRRRTGPEIAHRLWELDDLLAEPPVAIPSELVTKMERGLRETDRALEELQAARRWLVSRRARAQRDREVASLERRKAVLEARRAGLAAKEEARAEWFRRHEAELEERRILKTDEVLRARERVAEFRILAPSWVTESLGDRPPDPDRGRAWDRIAERALRYRWRNGIADEERGLFGPEPGEGERERVAEWRRAAVGIEMDRGRLERAESGRSLGWSIRR